KVSPSPGSERGEARAGRIRWGSFANLQAALGAHTWLSFFIANGVRICESQPQAALTYTKGRGYGDTVFHRRPRLHVGVPGVNVKKTSLSDNFLFCKGIFLPPEGLQTQVAVNHSAPWQLG